MLHLSFQSHEVKPELARPIIQTVPLQCPFHGFVTREQPCLCILGREIEALGKAPGNVCVPEMIVKLKVEQRPVQIEKDGFYGIPVEHRSKSTAEKGSRLPSITPSL